MTEMTLVQALERMAELNAEGKQTLIKDNAHEPETIESVIDQILDTEPTDDFHDYAVTDAWIRKISDTGYIDFSGEPLFKVVN